MFHLDTGVHLDEVMAAVLIHQELQSTGVNKADFLEILTASAYSASRTDWGTEKAGGKFNDLLITALQGAVTLVEVNHVAVFVSQDLDFDVLGLFQEFFNEDIVIAKGLFASLLTMLNAE